MSAITFSENHESDLIAFEAGQPLASLRDPRSEGLKWAYSLGVLPSSHIVIVGLGSGFHVAALADIDPHLKISVVESRESLIPVFRSHFPELRDRVEIIVTKSPEDIFTTDLFQEVIESRSYILSFRECWGQQSPHFTEVFSHLAGRTSESVRYHFEEFGINMKALYLRKECLLSIKDIGPVVEASTMPERNKQIFRVLNELVK
ncbi:MAG: hypothetical protein AAGB31_16220 [Bdellovibrio sp.]